VSDPSYSVEMRGIWKRYPRVVANKNASLSVREAEVHAVVGENGAGKSTLMKILYGLVDRDEGEILVRGKALGHHSPAEAIAAGVGMVFQHFMLVPTLTVSENIVLGLEPRRGIAFDRAKANEEVRRVSERFGLAIDPEMLLADCSVGLAQRVEILKVLYRGADVIILDEPTAVLTPQEVDELILVMKRLTGENKSIVLITHKLREVMAAAHRITVMRAGETIETIEARSTTADEIAEKMVGRRLAALQRSERAPSTAEVVLEVRNLAAESDRGLVAFRGADLAVRRGEILGIAGIEGNGQTELIECIAGLRTPTEGRVLIGGRDLTRAAPKERYAAGLAHVPEDRHKRAVVLDFTIEDNAILGAQEAFFRPLARLGAKIRAHAEAIVRSGDVRPPDRLERMRALSGGNQQKVVIGRELARTPKLLLAAHPTRGLDVGAIEHVQQRLREAREGGAAIVLVSGELSELLAMSDRMLVMFGGRIVGEVDPSRTTERELGVLMSGGASAGAPRG
jgi:general nucleoside transport system ATP-binding protein